MSSICAIADFSSRFLDFEALRSIGRAMLLRSRGERAAYINGGVGLLSCGQDCSLPFTLNVGAHRYTLLYDGAPTLPDAEGSHSQSQLILERFSEIGTDIFSELIGDYALIIFDEYDERLIIARDSLGARPLYFCTYRNGIAVSSEIKGLTALFTKGTRVCLDAYRSMLVAPSGTVGGAELFLDICELEASSFICIEKEDLKKERFSSLSYPQEATPPPPALDLRHIPPNLPLALCEAVIAFDHPQFDLYIPSQLAFIKSQRGKVELSYSEPFLEHDESYAYERADRLGMLFGIRATPALSGEREAISARLVRQYEKMLCEMLASLEARGNARRLFSLAGEVANELIKKERNPATRARIYALLLQTDFWIDNYRLSFC